ncbi:anhydro-N-acetylmuramic acid kinase [Polaribacter marinivivus]|uniref:Anhydro-N-acetylmuramic acid kinase n=1 Tax=Polaribacter marinivivus TaxID=1524260 RepID=A0ABV8RCL3_9FLAO
MMKSKVFSIGVMSGTSLDGIDLVYVSFNEKNYKDFSIIHAETIPYAKEWNEFLKNAIYKDESELKELDTIYGKYLGQTIQNFIYNYKIDKIDFIASHGHTIFHEPEKGITLQIGNGKEIANITKQKVVCDFRTQDVKLGGQGAPLVPIGDELLFSDFQYCINLGGFSNVSYQKDGQRLAFDICPVNIVLNYYANKLGFAYDESGKMAASGQINQQLLQQLNDLSFYDKEPPKSLGLEWVKSSVFPILEKSELDVKVILSTFVEHIAIQISKVIINNNSVLFTGGGVYNTFLMERIAYHSKVEINLPKETLIDFKEALIFSFLGLLKLKGEINCLKSVTGASKNHSSGVVFCP